MDGGRWPATHGGAGGSRSYRYTASWDAAEREVRRLQEELVASQAREAAAKAREEASLRRAEDLEAELLALHSSGQYLVNTLNAGVPGSSIATRMLRVPAHVRRILRRGIRQSSVVTMAMAEAHTEADCTGVGGFPESTPLNSFDLRAYEPSPDAVERIVQVDALLNDAA